MDADLLATWAVVDNFRCRKCAFLNNTYDLEVNAFQSYIFVINETRYNVTVLVKTTAWIGL